MEHVFTFSERAIEQKKRMFLLLHVVVLIIPVVIILPMAGLDLVAKTITLVVAVIVTELAMIIPQKVIYAKLIETEARITSEGVERKSGSFADMIVYKDIHQVMVTENPRDGVLSIEVQSSSGNLVLWGFENMDSLLSTLETRLVGTAVVSRKQQVVYASTMPIILAAMMAGWFLLFFWLKQYGAIVDGLLAFLMATFFLVGKPTSVVFGNRLRMFEIVVGGVLVLFAFFTLLHV